MMKKNPYRRKKRLSWAGIFLILAVATGSVSGEVVPDGIPEEDGRSGEKMQFWDKAHAAVSRSLNDTVSWFDGFFGDERYEMDDDDSSLKLKSEFFWKEEGELDFRQRVRIKLDLPQLEERLKLIFTTEREGELYAQGEGLAGMSAEETSSRSFLRWVGATTKKYNLHLDIGVRYRDGVKVFGELYGRWSVELNDHWIAHFREILFWTHKEKFGQATRVNFERIFRRNCFLRFSSEGMYSEESQGVEWRQDVIFYREVGVRKAVSLNAGVFGVTHPSAVTERYRAAVQYRQSLFRPWFFVEIEPEVNWYNEQDWDAVPQINFRCELVFGGK